MRFFKSCIPLFLCFALLLTACTLDSELIPSDSPIVTTATPANGSDITDAPSNAPSDTEPSDTPSDTETTLPPPEDTKPTEGTAPTEPATSPTIPKDSSFEVHFIDVGQADAALILCDGEAALIDGGNASDSSLIYSYLKKQGVSHLDYVIGTHANEDHIGGLPGALNAASVGTALCSVKSHDSKVFSNFIKAVEKHNKTITVPKSALDYDEIRELNKMLQKKCSAKNYINRAK